MRICHRAFAGLLFITLAVLSAHTAEDFIVTTRPLLIPERGPVETVVMVTPENQYSFIPPARWRHSPSSVEKKVVLQAQDFSATLSIRLGTYETNETVSLPEDLRNRLTNQYAGIKVLREFDCFTSSHKGRGFDGEWVVKATNLVAMRVAYLPVGKEMVEFNLTTVPDKFQKHNLLFGNLLTSFRVEPSHLKR